MYSNIALNTEIAKVKKDIDELEVELGTAEYERRLVLCRKIIERTNYASTTLYNYYTQDLKYVYIIV